MDKVNSLSYNPQSAPCLVFYHQDDNKHCSETFFSLLDGEFHTRDVTEALKSLVCCWPSTQGWMLILHNDQPSETNCFLFEPRTMRKLQLPPLIDLEHPTNQCDYRLALSASPLSNQCVVLFANKKKQCLHFCNLGSSEEKKWISYDYNNDIDNDEDTLVEFVVSNGKFYGKTTFDNHIALISYAPSPQVTLAKIACDYFMPGICRYNNSIVESCGDLFRVTRFLLMESAIDAGIMVYKLDFTKKSWEPVSNIGDDRVLLLGGDDHVFSISCSARELGFPKGNCVCFTRNETSLYVFDMDHGTLMEDRMRDLNLDSDSDSEADWDWDCLTTFWSPSAAI